MDLPIVIRFVPFIGLHSLVTFRGARRLRQIAPQDF